MLQHKLVTWAFFAFFLCTLIFVQNTHAHTNVATHSTKKHTTNIKHSKAKKKLHARASTKKKRLIRHKKKAYNAQTHTKPPITKHRESNTATLANKQEIPVISQLTTSTTNNEHESSNEPANKSLVPRQTELVTSIKKKVVDYIKMTVNTINHSKYKFGGNYFDTEKGIYVLDCSAYVDNILQFTYPNAYSNLLDATDSSKPTTKHYFDFFNELSYESNEYWSKIDDANELDAGDILVFRYKNSVGKIYGGHVMVVMDKPIRDADTYLVQIADSAPSAHSQDTRDRKTSGIGIGSLLLKADTSTGEPYAYAWKIGSRWKKNVDIAMARPTEA